MGGFNSPKKTSLPEEHVGVPSNWEEEEENPDYQQLQMVAVWLQTKHPLEQ
jgi:hypothetical protein